MEQFSNKSKEYDLEERTAKFSENTIELVRNVKKDNVNQNIITQLVRAATSIGANYCEANASSSKKTLETKYTFAKKRLTKRNIGLGY